MFAEAQGRDPARAKRWMVLVDGNPTQLRLIKKAAKRHGVEITIVLDIIHVARRYVWKAGVPHPWGGRASESALGHRAAARDPAGQPSARWPRGCAGARRCGACRPRHPAAVDRCADYLLKHRRYLRYDEYLTRQRELKIEITKLAETKQCRERVARGEQGSNAAAAAPKADVFPNRLFGRRRRPGAE